MATKKAANKPKTTKKNTDVPKAPRKMRAPVYNRFRYQKRIKHPGAKLPSGWQIFRGSLQVIRQNWRLFGLIVLIYAFLTVVLVRGFGSGLNISALKQNIQSLRGGSISVSDDFSLLGALFSSVASTSSQVGTAYQSMLLLVISLVLIWVLRRVVGQKPARQQPKAERPTARRAFYQGLYPLVPFLLVLIIVAIQLIPLAIGGSIYSTVINNGLAVAPAEKAAWAALFFVFAVWSLYMISATLIAMYIVTLPNMQPIAAWRSARQLVKYRRWIVLRKILFLPVGLLLIIAVVMLPLIIWVPVTAQIVFFVLGMFSLVVVHAYLYTLYKSLLKGPENGVAN